MSISFEDLNALTPASAPPSSVAQSGEGRDLRSLWSRHLQDSPLVATMVDAMEAIDSAWYLGVGLVPVSGVDLDIRNATESLTAAIHKTGYALGGVIYCNDSDLQEPYTVGPPVVDYTRNEFPIVVRRVIHEPQAIGLEHGGSLAGSVACWAERGGVQGCITAAHVVGSGTYFGVIDRGVVNTGMVNSHSSPSLDATFLETDWFAPHPQLFKPLDHSEIAFGDVTKFHGATTLRPVFGNVTHFSPHPKHVGSGSPMLVFHDGIGQAGDSGSMVQINSDNAAMHLSKVTLDSGVEESRAILLKQVANNMSLDLYR